MTSSLIPVSKRRSGATQKARALRRSETEAEYRLWGDLRNRLLNGYKFSRQIPLGPYVADFVCRERMLIVELDGSQHAESQSDLNRTRWLNANGYSVLRFWNHEVLEERRAVLETILATLEGKYSRSVKRSGSIRVAGYRADNMKIDEYVAQTLIDISKGVARAKEDALVGIAPGYVDGEKVFKEQLVSFEIVTTVTHEGGGSVRVLSLADMKAGSNIEKTNKLFFSVPVFFQAPPASGVGPNPNKESKK